MSSTDDSLAPIRAILSTGSLEQLIDMVEDDRLEFKSGAYALDDDRGKHELAKDICGLLNAGGGLIVLGAKTTKDMVRFADVVAEVSEFESTLVNPDQLRSIAQGLIYPALPAIEIKWYESTRKPGRGLVAIDIPETSSSNTPYLMVKALDDAGKLRGSLFGYFQRKLANIEALSAQQMHLMLREGARAGELRTLRAILELLNSLDRQKEAQATFTREARGLRFSALRTDAQKAFGEEKGPQIFLAADPQPQLELKDLFRSREAETVRILENPERLRHGGWDLNVDGESEIIRGQLRRKARPGYKVLQISREGTIMFMASGRTARELTRVSLAYAEELDFGAPGTK